MIRLLLSIALALSFACRSTAPIATAPAATAAYAAEGIFIRHVRIRVAPAQTQDFEALMARCVLAAHTAKLGEAWNWLCYRESPGRYWLVSFSRSATGFAIPKSPQPLVAHVRTVANCEGPDALTEIEERLAALEYEVEWTLLARQKVYWSTDLEMTTREFPKARLMLRTVRPGHEAPFERALAERVAFLAEHDYPLPIEGFVTLSGAPGTALQVVFPRDWSSFHARESFWQFAQHLPAAEREEYLRRKDALMKTMASAEYYDADIRPDASYGSN